MVKLIAILADLFTIGASAIAIYLFIFKRGQVAMAFRLLSTYAYQTTLSELREKLERLNEYNAAEPGHYDEVINVFHEIHGQISGNPKLKDHFTEFLARVERSTSGKRKLTEPMKRSLISELREGLKHLNVDSIEKSMGDEK